MTDKPVIVPSPDEFRFTPEQWQVFQAARRLTRDAIAAHDMRFGISAVVSGVTREVRAYLVLSGASRIQAARISAGLLLGLAETAAEAASYDDPKQDKLDA